MKKKNFNLYIVLIECCIFILLPFLSELILRKLKVGFNYYPLNPSLISHHIHPKNFEFTSYSLKGEWGNFNIKTDEFGNRIYLESCKHDKKNPKKYFFLGDSYVSAFQSKNEDTIVGIFEEKVCKEGAKVFNLAVGGYSPVLSYIHLLHYLEHKSTDKSILKDSVVIHYLSSGHEDDISKDNTYSKKVLYEAKSNLPFIPNYGKLSFLQSISRKSYLVRLLRRFHLQALNLLLQANRESKYITSYSLNTTKFPIPSNSKCMLDSKDYKNTLNYIDKINQLIISYKLI